MQALCDYQTDNRGDVGSWVREAAIASMLPMLVEGCPPEHARATDPTPDAAAERAALASALPSLCHRFVELLTQVSGRFPSRSPRHSIARLLAATLALDAHASAH